MRQQPALIAILLFAIGLIALCLFWLSDLRADISVSQTRIEETPITIFAPEAGKAGKNAEIQARIVIAHGFAGSQQLMQSFALTFAANGYEVVTFDFLGHGRNTRAMTGDITREDGATRALMANLNQVVVHSGRRSPDDRPVILLGHSMASDIVVRQAANDPNILATIAISMFSTAVTQTDPRNLLMITGEWESFLRKAARDTLSLTVPEKSPNNTPEDPPETPLENTTYGDFGAGTARRAAVAPGVEHVAVLYSDTALREAVAWADQTLGHVRQHPIELRNSGYPVIGLILGLVLLFIPLARLLPRLRQIKPRPNSPHQIGWRNPNLRFAAAGIIPALATPLLLWPVPTAFLPVLVADYLALHFLVYGLISLIVLHYLLPPNPIESSARPWRRMMVCGAVTLFGTGAIGLALDLYGASFAIVGDRVLILACLLIGTTTFIVSDEWLTRGAATPSPITSEHTTGLGRYIYTKLCFLGSLALAIALDLESLFFLIIIAPVIAIFFVIYGIFSQVTFRATCDPTVIGVANAIAFAWALAATFPLVIQ